MNTKYFNGALLIAIVLTLAALTLHAFIPKKRFLATPNREGTYYLYSSKLPDGSLAGSWLDEAKQQFRCKYPEGFSDRRYYCSFNQAYLFSETKGIDLSRYETVNLRLKYTGSASKVRFFARNFNPAYSSAKDNNSTKYNAVLIPAGDLNKELSIKVGEFAVTEWWLLQYKMPYQYSHAELNNVVNIGIDFSDPMNSGNHDITLEKIEFVGEWVSKENWYLMILSAWMIGIFVYASNQLRLLRKQKIENVKLINQLSQNNASLKIETDKFRRLSTVDPLTQAYNRFGIDQVVATLIALRSDANEPAAPKFSLIILDIDDFKRINDRRGHDVGDRVLQGVANITQENIRASDFLGRWGGEEFIVILPNTRKEFAIVLAEKIRLAISETLFERDNPLTVTASLGVADLDPDQDFANTFKRADGALYKAKQLGKNCCLLADSVLHSEASGTFNRDAADSLK
jgi:diguanylate cyclase (GGDEF)-like protein